MAEVIDLSTRDGIVGAGRHLDPDAVLEANKGVFERVVICGVDKAGGLLCASTDGPADTLWTLDLVKARLLAGGPWGEP